MKKSFYQSYLIFPNLPRHRWIDVYDMIVERTQEGKAIAKLNPDFKEGRPKKFSKVQINHALDLLSEYSYKQVEQMTGISKSTLIRAKRRQF